MSGFGKVDGFGKLILKSKRQWNLETWNRNI